MHSPLERKLSDVKSFHATRLSPFRDVVVFDASPTMAGLGEEVELFLRNIFVSDSPTRCPQPCAWHKISTSCIGVTAEYMYGGSISVGPTKDKTTNTVGADNFGLGNSLLYV